MVVRGRKGRGDVHIPHLCPKIDGSRNPNKQPGRTTTTTTSQPQLTSFSLPPISTILFNQPNNRLNCCTIMASTTAPDEPLFSPHLISPTVLAALPEGYTCRPLRKSDYHSGFLDVLRVLTTVGDISEEAWNERYEWMSKRNDEYFLMVIVDTARETQEEKGKGGIVGTGCLVVERKL